MWVCSSKSTQSFFVLRLFISPWPAGILGEVSGEDLNRTFINFLGVSFNILIYQNVHTGGSEVIFQLVSFLKNVIKNIIENETGLRPFCPKTVWDIQTICS